MAHLRFRVAASYRAAGRADYVPHPGPANEFPACPRPGRQVAVGCLQVPARPETVASPARGPTHDAAERPPRPRPVADQEADRRLWHRPFASANDGTSGVAWMMELGHHVKDLPTTVGVDFVLFDGEEYVFDGHQDRYFFGSDHFADEYQKQKPAHRYVGAVLLDLFAGKDAHYPVEQNSLFLAGALAQDVWKIAAEQGVTAFQNRVGPQVQ